MTDKHNDEIDLGLVFRKMKEGYHSLLVSGYKGVQFVKRFWIVLLILIIGGVIAGHFWQKAHKADKLATLIVQNNFGSSSYVYNAIELLNRKMKQGDGRFLKRYGFNPETPELVTIEIEPIVNIMELMEKSESNDRNLEQYLAQSDFEEDILLSEVFYTEYKYHKMFVYTTAEGSMETVDKVLAYLNSNEIFQQTKELMIAETTNRIKQNETSIENIDAVFDEYVGKINNSQPNPSQVFFKSQENNNLHQLIEWKNILISENEMLRKELIKYDNVVTVINSPELHFTFTFWDNKRLIVPLFLILFFVFLVVLYGLYKKGERYAMERQ